MSAVKAIGAQEAKAKKIALITEILSIIFIFVPFLDEVAPAIIAANGVFHIAGAAGNVALGIQQIISAPASAPVAILGILTAGGLRNADDFSKMAKVRREISGNDLEKIGTKFKKMDADFQVIAKRSCKL